MKTDKIRYQITLQTYFYIISYIIAATGMITRFHLQTNTHTHKQRRRGIEKYGPAIPAACLQISSVSGETKLVIDRWIQAILFQFSTSSSSSSLIYLSLNHSLRMILSIIFAFWIRVLSTWNIQLARACAALESWVNSTSSCCYP